MQPVFPQSAQTSKPWLETWLRDRHHDRAKALIEAELDRNLGGDDTRIQFKIVEALQVDRIELDPVREYLDEPWIRQMPAPSTMAQADPRRGIYPGTAYREAYDRYRLHLRSGAELVTLAANGGPALLDPMFVGYVDGCIEIRASDDAHRDQLIGYVETYVEEANRIINKWNGPDLHRLVELELRNQTQQRQAAEHRRTTKEQAGFTRAATEAPRRLPLPDSKRTSPTAPPRQRPDGVRYALEDDQFAAILEALATHRNYVERNPGAGAPADAGEEDHRDQVLAALGQRFTDGTAEAFSRLGKTDIRLVVDGDCYFHAEAKIWGGPSSVDEAIGQLLGRYLVPRDRHGALVFFIRDRANPNRIPAKAIDRLIESHGGTRIDDVAGFPVVRTPAPGGDGRWVDLAVVTITVDTQASP